VTNSIVDVMNQSPLLTAVWFSPMAAGGIVLATLGGFTLHLLPGSVLLVISGLGSLATMLLFAFMPEDTSAKTFWAFVFPVRKPSDKPTLTCPLITLGDDMLDCGCRRGV